MATSLKNRRPARKGQAATDKLGRFVFKVSDADGNANKFYTADGVSKWSFGRVGVSVEVDQERRA